MERRRAMLKTFRTIIFLSTFIVSSYAHAGVLGDIDGDGQVGLPEAVYAIQSLAGIRSPLAKDDALKNIITVAKANGHFTDPVAAVNSITDASATNPYLVVIGPGVYTITQTLQMKEYVDIVGSGENVTRLTGGISSGTQSATSAIISGANNATLSSLTVENTGGGSNSIGFFNGSASPMVCSVTVKASGGDRNYGVHNYYSSPTMTDVIATASGGTYNFGVYNENSSPTMTDVTATASGGTYSYGVYHLYSSSSTMIGGTATASGGTNNHGVSNWYSSPTMIRGTARASGGTSSVGVMNYMSSIKISRSTIQGDTECLIGYSGSSTTVSQSTLIGTVDNSGNKCVACDNGSGTALGADCK